MCICIYIYIYSCRVGREGARRSSKGEPMNFQLEHYIIHDLHYNPLIYTLHYTLYIILPLSMIHDTLHEQSRTPHMFVALHIAASIIRVCFTL